MTTLHIRGTLGRASALLLALFLVHAGGAIAADRTGDAQAQARELLSRATTHEPTAAAQVSAVAGGGSLPTESDPQEQARRLILGARSAYDAAASTRARSSNAGSFARAVGHYDRRARADGQEMARRMILGQG